MKITFFKSLTSHYDKPFINIVSNRKMFNVFSLGVNRIIDLDAVDYKVVPGFFL